MILSSLLSYYVYDVEITDGGCTSYFVLVLARDTTRLYRVGKSCLVWVLKEILNSNPAAL